MDNKKPKIRFKGFTDDWEQHKLSDYLIVSNEKNKESQYGIEDVFSVSGDYGVVNQIEFQGRSFAGADVSNYGVVLEKDVVYTKSPLNSSPYGIIKTNKLKPGIVSVLYAVYHPLSTCDSNFVQTYFEQNARLNNYLRPLISKGAKNTINVSDETIYTLFFRSSSGNDKSILYTSSTTVVESLPPLYPITQGLLSD